MVTKTLVIYCIVDDILGAMNHREDIRRKISGSEVITAALSAAVVFSGNIEKARCALFETGLIPDMPGKSRLNRRIRAVSGIIRSIFFELGTVFKNGNASMEYVLDSVPIPVCDNIRIKRSKIVRSESYRGHIASKKRFFCGIRLHILATSDGIPVEFVFFPGTPHDLNALYELPFDLPEGSEIYADSAYTNYRIEDDLKEFGNIVLSPARKKNSKRRDEPHVRRYKQRIRKQTETVFSEITGLFPKKIHAVTFEGFLLKIILFILGHTLSKAFCQTD